MTDSVSTSTGIPGFRIRRAKEKDTALILEFIKDLACYEKLAHEVSVTKELLKQNLFGEARHAEVIIGEYQSAPVAFALYFHNFSTFLGKPGIYLEDLYVKEEARGRGIGKTMLAYLARLAVKRGCGRVEWWVLDWNSPAIDFYERLGATTMDEWTVYRLSGEKLEELAEQFGNQ